MADIEDRLIPKSPSAFIPTVQGIKAWVAKAALHARYLRQSQPDAMTSENPCKDLPLTTAGKARIAQLFKETVPQIVLEHYFQEEPPIDDPVDEEIWWLEQGLRVLGTV